MRDCCSPQAHVTDWDEFVTSHRNAYHESLKSVTDILALTKESIDSTSKAKNALKGSDINVHSVAQQMAVMREFWILSQ
jgi:hypothetical protein